MKTNIVYMQLIGWSGSDPKKRNIAVLQNGWPGYIEQYIKPAIDLGFERFEIHNPAGCLSNEDMQADQFITAKNEGLKFITDSFVQSWRPITEKYEVICYMGSPSADSTFKDISVQKKPGNYLFRLWDAYRLPIEAGMSIGFDASAGLPEVDPTYAFMDLLHSLGINVYLESWHQKNRPWTFKYPSLFGQSVWENMQKDLSWPASMDEIKTEKIRALLTAPKGKDWKNLNEWLSQWIADCWKCGHTAMIPGHSFVKNKTNVLKYLEANGLFGQK